MSDSVPPHRRQPTSLHDPWDSPGKNTRVGCHFLLQCMKVKSKSEVAQSCPTLHDTMDCSLPLSMGILLARIREWVAMPSWRGSSRPRNRPRSLANSRCNGESIVIVDKIDCICPFRVDFYLFASR